MRLLDDLCNLDRHNIGDWPHSVKMLFTVLWCAVIMLIGWCMVIKDQQVHLRTLAGREEQLKREFSRKQAESVNLEALQRQLDGMKDMLRQLLRQLPGKTEMPELLVDVSQTALSAGLQQELFQPDSEILKDFYAEKPIQLKMVGTYHQFGAFISGVASLPRVVILTMHDVSLALLHPPAKDAEPVSHPLLVLQGTVKTYRYLEDAETGEASHNAKKSGEQP